MLVSDDEQVLSLGSCHFHGLQEAQTKVCPQICFSLIKSKPHSFCHLSAEVIIAVDNG